MSEGNFEKNSKETAEKTAEKKVLKSESKFSLKDIISGKFLTSENLKKHYPFLGFLVIIVFFYIDNRYFCEKQLAEIAALEKELVDKKYESLTISSELIQMSRQSKVIEEIEKRGLGLKVATEPAIEVN